MVDVVGVLVGIGSRRTLFWECGVKKFSRVRFLDIVVVQYKLQLGL